MLTLYVFCFCGTISNSIFAFLLIADNITASFIKCYVQDEDFFKSLGQMLQDC
jgi:hypothetical protein